MSSITITVAFMETGASDSMPVTSITKVSEVMEFCQALMGVPPSGYVLTKNGKPLPSSQTLQDAGVVDGDLLAVAKLNVRPAPAPAPAPAASGALDFSSLLAGASPAPAAAASPAGGLDFSSLLGAGAAAAPTSPPPPVFYPGMNLEECMGANRHPSQFVQVLFEHDLLWKQLHYYHPSVAKQIQPVFGNVPEASKIWQNFLVTNGIKIALKNSEKQALEAKMKSLRATNPNDPEVVDYYKKQDNDKLIQQQHFQMMQEFPESMGRILMLYIQAKVNGVPIQTFVDSGAQMTVMSLQCAKKVGIDHLIDTRYEGTAVGVGTQKIMGRVHLVGLQVASGGSKSYHFPCTITVMESSGDKNMEFLLGLDMLKRHRCSIDLAAGQLQFQISPTETLRTPFLHEHQLPESKGGTQGFDAAKANQEIEERRQKMEKEDKMEE